MKGIIGYIPENIWLVMDNSPVHHAKVVLNYLNDTGWSMIFLPQYAPEMAPIELFFGQHKKMITFGGIERPINLKKVDGMNFIVDHIKSIDLVSILKLWRHFLLQAEQSLEDIKTIIMN